MWKTIGTYESDWNALKSHTEVEIEKIRKISINNSETRQLVDEIVD